MVLLMAFKFHKLGMSPYSNVFPALSRIGPFKVGAMLRALSSFFMYKSFFGSLRIILPFTEFEYKLLTQVNVTPMQLHPNSFTFFLSFEVLMKFFVMEASLNIFFSFCQSKGIWKGLWVSLSGHLRKKIFSLYQSSYKEFKDRFSKVKSLDAGFPFFLDEFGLARFLYIGIMELAS